MSRTPSSCDESNEWVHSEEEEVADDKWIDDCEMVESLDVELEYWDPDSTYVVSLSNSTNIIASFRF